MESSSELKENPPLGESLSAGIHLLSLSDTPVPLKNLEIQPPVPPGRTEEERQAHQKFTNEALEMARLALRTNETPVGCVLVHKGIIIARGMNATNVTRNGTRHAEFMAIAALLARPLLDGIPRTADASAEPSNLKGLQYKSEASMEIEPSPPANHGYLYPYGQKLHPSLIVDRSIIQECVLYVTVEPCVMCASLLRQLQIRKVFFGAVNDKFGGTGGVFSIHQNSGLSNMESAMPDGDGGNIEPGFEVEGGWGRDEAVGLLRRFYVQENGRAPIPRKKEGRAARLAALERDANGNSTGTHAPHLTEGVDGINHPLQDEQDNTVGLKAV
ncbi:hypothetical protein jhhlp_000574 [Lomentospora prolificans]|uniref:CMP/dCMP-type deaminase domain-containing protein n=1 Tax=Lomentospora prolificans TaxID=41688 RepID=A0A2N3NLE7_9PEZI|nr:hypothetical protein jhhlp_000574 [Lomentospora prolificans]